jgi:hypothetical protein
MTETLLAASEIKLYGRAILGLSVDPGSDVGLGANGFLKKQLETDADNPPKFARIYAFSYEGQYYVLPKPAIFLVHGDDVAASNDAGVAAKNWDFSPDIQAWTYDKGDFSIRLDIETGPLEQILLEARAAPDPRQVTLRGSRTHLREGGSRTHLRDSGGGPGRDSHD